MESSRNKREYGHSQEDKDHQVSESKRQKLPALASVIVEAVKMDSLQRLCSSLEPLLRRVVSEEGERALSRLGQTNVTARSLPPRLQGPDGRILQLRFRTRMPPHLFTGGKVEGEQGAAIHVVLLDANSGRVVGRGPESAAKVNIVVLEGDFNDEADDDWTKEHFESFEVKEREGKRPLLTGDLQVALNEGVGTLGDLTFTDNSSWIRSRKFRLGVKVAQGYCEGLRIREAKTEAFTVKDHRGELYKKHYPPALHDEVWRLDRIAKDGALHKKLLKANIVTVEDFLGLLIRDPQRLRNILGSGMSNRMWENTVEHAKTCVLGGKLYVYYPDATQSTGAVFSQIYEFRGLIADGQFHSLESFSNDQRIAVDLLVKKAYENWHEVVEYDGKALSCLPSTEKGLKAISTAPNGNGGDHHLAVTAQPKPHLTEYRPAPQYHQPQNKQAVSVRQLIEFPFARCDESPAQPLGHQQLPALPDDTYTATSVPGNPPAVLGGYYSGEWGRGRSGMGLEDIFAEEIRVRSSEMLESDDMQRLLKTFSVGGGGISHGGDRCYSYKGGVRGGEGRGRGSGKAVVGWLKLKAALRWGIFVRKKAAERRPQVVELD